MGVSFAPNLKKLRQDIETEVAENYLQRSKVAGGTTAQVLKKASNADEAMAWGDASDVNVRVDSIPEVITLAADQTIVDFATITTQGAAFYRDGVRLMPDQYTINSATRITLATSYTAGTKILGVINEPQAESFAYTPVSGGGQLLNNSRNLITDSNTYTLPPVATLEAGALILASKLYGQSPIIQAEGGEGEQIKHPAGQAASYGFSQDGKLLLMFDGTNWQTEMLQGEPEIGSNASGSWIRWPNGYTIARKKLQVTASTIINENIGTYGWSYMSGGATWVYPVEFLSDLTVGATPEGAFISASIGSNPSNTQCFVGVITTRTEVDKFVHMEAKGFTA